MSSSNDRGGLPNRGRGESSGRGRGTALPQQFIPSTLALQAAGTGTQQYLITNVRTGVGGHTFYGTLQDARSWFQYGYHVLDVDTRQPVDIGSVPVPSFASGQGAFGQQQDDLDATRRALEDEERERAVEKRGGAGQNGMNGSNGWKKDDEGNGGAAPA